MRVRRAALFWNFFCATLSILPRAVRQGNGHCNSDCQLLIADWSA
jgi:hypothetical protein